MIQKSTIDNLFRYKDRTTVITATDYFIQSGWDFAKGNSTGEIHKTITFPEAFADNLIALTLTFAGEWAGGDPTSFTNLTNPTSDLVNTPIITAYSITTTNFIVCINSGGTPSADTRIGFSWIAVGKGT